MDYREHLLDAGLSRHIEAMWTLSSGGRLPSPEAGTIVPDGHVEIVLSFAAPMRSFTSARRLPSRFVVGQMSQPWRLSYQGPVELLGVRVSAAATRRLLLVPPLEYANRIVALRALAPALDVLLRDAVRTCQLRRDRLVAVAAAMGTWIAARAPGSTADVLEPAVAMILRSHGRLRVDAIARRAGLSRRQIERQFLRDVGLSPKRFSRIIRFQPALSPTDTRRPIARLALELGYADHAHFSREFRQLTGVPPSRAWWLGG